MTGKDLHISLIQYDIIWEDPAANRQELDHAIEHLPETNLIVLPEMWSTGFSMQPEKIAEHTDGPSLHWMKRTAKDKNAVVAGSISTKSDHGFVNRFYFVFPGGDVVHYDKKHLFSYGREDQHYIAGHDQLDAVVNDWKIKPIICYDLRFPVWCRNTNDYDILLVVANWPAARIHHWDALLKARAIENQCYVVAVNRIGTDANGLHYSGHSTVYNMNGDQIVNMDEAAGVNSFSLTKASLYQFREQFRFLQDRDSFSL